jgi:hypothetical protein
MLKQEYFEAKRKVEGTCWTTAEKAGIYSSLKRAEVWNWGYHPKAVYTIPANRLTKAIINPLVGTVMTVNSYPSAMSFSTIYSGVLLVKSVQVE